jgi:hypothetical protein
MTNYVKLPCGCKLTPTWVHSMCVEHFMEYRAIISEQDRKWAEVRAEMLRAAAPPVDKCQDSSGGKGLPARDMLTDTSTGAP